ncbi:MAG TPA: hypothetical protein VFW50_11965 [Streptosporangiaceae bacterium]|nr:hypothetical protein [Streptosporangiaceae bacterium]
MPQREGLRGSRPRLIPAGGPGGPQLIRPRRPAVEVLWTDSTWHSAVCRGFCHPEGGFRGILSDITFEWTVLLDFPASPDLSGWYCYESRFLRVA